MDVTNDWSDFTGETKWPEAPSSIWDDRREVRDGSCSKTDRAARDVIDDLAEFDATGAGGGQVDIKDLVDKVDVSTYAMAALDGNWKFINPAPFQEVPLIGSAEQSTVHFHCGINNDEKSILEARDCLYKTLGESMAVQPHLIHNDSMIGGVALVQCEKMAPACRLEKETLPSFVPPEERTTFPLRGLESSSIQESIAYEKERLACIADEILARKQENLKQAHVTFSNGGYVFKKALEELTPEQRDTIVVVTLGTTEVIEDKLACKVYNVIGSKDWPSKSCVGNTLQLKKQSKEATIEIVQQKETKWVIGGHYFLQDDYQTRTRDIFEKIKGNYALY